MSTAVIVIYLAIQFIVQLAVYLTIKKHLFWACFSLWKTFGVSIEFCAKTLSFLLFVVNILISILVKEFTSSGGLTGVTNLGASVILGFIMYFDVDIFERELKKVLKEN